MERRRFLSGSILGAAGAVVVGAASPRDADAQQRQRRGGPCPPVRAEWSGSGAPDGRSPVDAGAMTDEERGHVPVLTLPERVRSGRAFDLVVQIGARPHEITEAHRIEWIEVCVDERRVLVADLSADVAYPIVRVPLVLRAPATLTARARCNQHGVWITRRAIDVG